MTFAKHFGLRLLAGLFTISIFGLASATAINHVFSKPDNLKAALANNKVYDAVANQTIKDAAEQTTSRTSAPLASEAAEQAARSAITPDIIQENGEKVIDGTYHWLDGSAPTPDFTLDTKEIKDKVVTNVTGAGEARVRKLPACTVAQLQKINIQTADPFTLPCRPPGVNISTLTDQYRKELTASDAFLEDASITAADIKDKQGQNVFTEADQIPQAFQLGQKLPWFFAAVALLAGPAIVLLHDTKRRGVKALCMTLLITGILLAIMIVGASWMLTKAEPEFATTSAPIQSATLAVIHDLSGALSKVLALFAGVYTALGLGGLILLRAHRLQQHTPDTDHPDSQPFDAALSRPETFTIEDGSHKHHK